MKKPAQAGFFVSRPLNLSSRVSIIRTRIYIDGYNFYYGCLKGSPYKWLDLYTLFTKYILPSVAYPPSDPSKPKYVTPVIKYFTAEIIDKAAKAPDSVQSQQQYHRALRLLYQDEIEVIKGYYSVAPQYAWLVDAKNPKALPRDCERVEVWKFEEKQSDVNLALHAFCDAIKGDVDQIVVVTNDTDIAPMLEHVRLHTDVIVGLVNPTLDKTYRQPNGDLRELAHWVRSEIRPEELQASALPRAVPHPKSGKGASKPISWYSETTQLVINEVLKDKRRAEAFKWLEAANPLLENKPPIELAETEAGAKLVIDYIKTYRQNQTTGSVGSDQTTKALGSS